MSYLVLARKWRPQTFAGVIGQDHVTRTLMKAVEKGRLAHAYLFAGPRGCGKTTTARLLAKVINCERPVDAEPCNECASCLAVAEGRHLDMIEIDGASNRGIDEIRDLREKIGYAPSQSASKIYIIDEVHMLTPQAFNALLKTLEEPPAHVYLVFATTEPHKVPATILSRCQRFNFKRLELGEIVGQLERICDLEKVERDGEALVMIARRADGSMRDAESLLDQCISAAEGRVDLDLVRSVLGLVDTRLVFELLSRIAERERHAALDIVDRAVSAGLDLEEFFLAYMEGLRNLLVLSLRGDGEADWLDLTGAELEEARSIADRFGTDDLLFLFRAAARHFRDFKGVSQPRFHLEAVVAEAASWERAVELSELLRRLDEGGGPGRSGGGAVPAGGKRTGSDGESGGNGRRAGAERPLSGAARLDPDRAVREGGPGTRRGSFATVARDEGGGDVSPAVSHSGAAAAKLGGRGEWERFLSQIRETKLTLGIWLVSAELLEVGEELIVLGFGPQQRFAGEMVREEKNRRYIEGQLERFFGRKFTIEVRETGTGPVEPVVEDRTSRQDPGTTALVDHIPLAKKLIDEFEGEVLADGE